MTVVERVLYDKKGKTKKGRTLTVWYLRSLIKEDKGWSQNRGKKLRTDTVSVLKAGVQEPQKKSDRIPTTG